MADIQYVEILLVLFFAISYGEGWGKTQNSENNLVKKSRYKSLLCDVKHEVLLQWE